MNNINISESIGKIGDNFVKSNFGTKDKDESFNSIFQNAIDNVNQYQKEADNAVTELAVGQEKDIHKTMIALEKSAISLQMLIEIRNSVIDAYKELTRMQV
jgi:flagellar hook-basal body complex protein FliE